MALTDSAIRVLKPRGREYKITDEKGLYLLVTPAGGRLWKLKFRTITGVEKKLSLGAYPEISLKDARERRDSARSELAKGVDPAQKKREEQRLARLNAATHLAPSRGYLSRKTAATAWRTPRSASANGS